MTIQHFRIFAMVYEEKSMTVAANKLFMTQPSVSQAIKELESYYGVILFERLSNKLYITEAGKKLYEYVIHIIKLFDESKDNVKGNALKKKLIIGANYTVGTVLIHKYIEKYKSLYPDSEIMVFVNKDAILAEMLRKNELDLALMEENNQPDLIEDFFHEDRIAVIANPEHHLFAKKEVTASDIVNEHLLLREKGVGVRNLFELRINQAGLSVKPYWESTSTTALINAAVNKIGIAVLSYQLVKNHIASGSLKELKVKDMDFSRKLTIAYHKNKFLTSTMKDFMKICHEL